MRSRAFKRCFDGFVAGFLLVVLAPLFAVVAALILANLGSPVLFIQERPGLLGKPFRLYKFRSMREGYVADEVQLTDAERLGRFGAFLRSTSLDELPELWNVLMGDMSLVGPRPLLMEYLPLFSPEQARRHEVRPGITGLAQVNGRNALTWEEKFRYDVWYVDHWSMGLDLQILCRTVLRVVGAQNINQAGHATVEKFRGSSR